MLTQQSLRVICNLSLLPLLMLWCLLKPPFQCFSYWPGCHCLSPGFGIRPSNCSPGLQNPRLVLSFRDQDYDYGGGFNLQDKRGTPDTLLNPERSYIICPNANVEASLGPGVEVECPSRPGPSRSDEEPGSSRKLFHVLDLQKSCTRTILSPKRYKG